MERDEMSAIAHEGMLFQNPLDPDRVNELVELLDLPAGARVVDLGCGTAELLTRIAERWDASGVGVDRNERFLARARAHERVELVRGDALRFGEPASFDLAMSVGALERPLARLIELTRPGGLVLLGDAYWRAEPTGALRAEIGPDGLVADYAGTVAAGEALGLTPLYAVAASLQDWDRYEWRWSLNGERWAAANPDRAADLLAWVRGGRERYLRRGGREALGFGLFLFRT